MFIFLFSIYISVISIYSSSPETFSGVHFSLSLYVHVCGHFSWLLTLPPVRSPADCHCSLSSQSPPLNRWVHLMWLLTVNTTPAATAAGTHVHFYILLSVSSLSLRVMRTGWDTKQTTLSTSVLSTWCIMAKWSANKAANSGWVCVWNQITHSPHLTELWCICFSGSHWGIFLLLSPLYVCVFACI